MLVFVISLFLNLFILASYSIYNPENDRLNYPSFGNIQQKSNNYNNKDQTITIILTIGSIHCVLSGLIFLYFAMKEFPLLIEKTIIKQENFLKSRKVLRLNLYYKAKFFIFTCFSVFSNVNVLYQFGFLTFSILALAIHPFFFAVHLLDILYRFPSLQSIIKAITTR